MDLLVAAVVAVLVVVAATSVAPRVGVAAPLLLVLVGIAVSFLPVVPAVEVRPEWVLEGILPLLLYASATAVPMTDFRRDLRTISAFSVVLVVVTTAAVGFTLHALVPGVDLATAFAVGAVVSPTDAVATSIVRTSGVSRRITTVLDGESMLNDATALVLLRSAVVAIAGAVSAWGVVGDFVVAVVVAVLVGYVVGRLHVLVRAHVTETTSNVAISFVVPFVAYLPAERLGASGLVAVVVAGLVTGAAAPRALRARDRVTENAVWRTIELVLEGLVFLVLGLEVFGLVLDVEEAHGSVWFAVGLAVVTATVVVAVRAVFVAGAVSSLSRRADDFAHERDVLVERRDRLDEARAGPGDRHGDAMPAGADEEGGGETSGRHSRHDPARRDPARRVRRRLADIDYLVAQRFGRRDGVLLVWAGMRGAVTVAAAQSLPSDVPDRSLLVLVAYVVAVGTLVVQGTTLPWLTRRLGLTAQDDDGAAALGRLRRELGRAAVRRLDDPGLRRPDGTPYPERVVAMARRRLAAIGAAARTEDEGAAADRRAARRLLLVLLSAQREELLRLRDLGDYPSDALDRALVELDTVQIGLELRS